MTKLYPNDFDIYGFDPVEQEEHGKYVVDRLTGALGRVIYDGGRKCVLCGGVKYEIKKP